MAYRILIVDDSTLWRDIVSMLLKAGGMETCCADSGLAALEILRREHVDLMLLDLSMPGMDGPSMLEQLRNEPDSCHPPVIMVTAGTERVSVLKLSRLRVRRCLIKSNLPTEDLPSIVLSTIQEVARAGEAA